jgi:putative oxidoreductase
MSFGLLVLRVVVGGLFMAHGAQKLFGWFGGAGVPGVTAWFGHLGLRPARVHAVLAGLFESIGGALIAAGLLTPLGSLVLTATMVVAIITVHRGKGLWNDKGGCEFNAVLIAAVLAVAAAGPGDWSLDHALDLDISGSGWAIAAALAGIAGGALVVAASRRQRSST